PHGHLEHARETLPFHTSLDQRFGLAESNQLLGARGAKRAQRPEQIQRFEQVGLALRVITRKDVEPGMQLDDLRRDVAKISELEGDELQIRIGMITPRYSFFTLPGRTTPGSSSPPSSSFTSSSSMLEMTSMR